MEYLLGKFFRKTKSLKFNSKVTWEQLECKSWVMISLNIVRFFPTPDIKINPPQFNKQIFWLFLSFLKKFNVGILINFTISGLFVYISSSRNFAEAKDLNWIDEQIYFNIVLVKQFKYKGNFFVIRSCPFIAKLVAEVWIKF